jgi:hypothetical protein
MKIVFYASDKPREIMLAKALADGARALDDSLEIRRTGEYGETPEGDDLKYPGPTPDTDVACCFGVKGKSRQVVEDHRALGIATLFFDKGYYRSKGEMGHTEYSRISVNAGHPLKYMMERERSPDRFDKLNSPLRPRVKQGSGGHVLFCCSSAKYHQFHKLEEPNIWAVEMVKTIRRYTQRHIVYRPKPSWKGAKPIGGTSFSDGSTGIQDALRGCHCLVTHGSAAAMDAVLAGVPAIVLGNSVAKPVSGGGLESLESLYWPSDEERQRWANAMAYCQWTAPELRSGEAWAELRAEIGRQRA